MNAKGEETRREYEFRINSVIDYINKNLDKQIPLEHLAEIACFSKYHFHRIFSSFVNETLSDYIRRLRLEKAASMLIFNPRKTITEIALDCGFSSSANFAKAFKIHFNETASDIRKKWDFRNFGKQFSNFGQKDSNERKDFLLEFEYNLKIKGAPKVVIHQNLGGEKMSVEVKEMPEFRVAYIRHVGAYDTKTIGPVFDKLMKWAGSRGYANEKSLVLGVSWDNPEITPADKLRYDACVVVADDVQADGEVGIQVIPGGKFAVLHTIVENFDFQSPWLELMQWLPDSGYQPDDRPCYELYHHSEDTTPGRFDVEVCEPVKPL